MHDARAGQGAPAAIAVLFVCTGNICRSPAAEGVLRVLVAHAGLSGRITVDSAGTEGYHLGDPPDARMQAHALRRGYDLSDLRARRVTTRDFARFDLLLAMDRSHLAALQRMKPDAAHGSPRLFLDYAPRLGTPDVPDPYYGEADGFELVLDLVERGAEGLLRAIREGLHEA